MSELSSEQAPLTLASQLGALAGRADGSLQEEIAAIQETAQQIFPLVQQSRLAQLSTRLAVHFFTKKSLPRFFEGVLDELIAEVGARTGALLLFNANEPEARIGAARTACGESVPHDRVRVSRSILARVLEGQDSVLVEDALTDDDYRNEESVRRFSFRSVLAIPLRIQNFLAGAIHLENGDGPSAFGEPDREILRGAGRLIAIYLDAAFRLGEETSRRLRIYEEVKGKTHFDGLVGASPSFLEVLETVKEVGPSDAAVFIEGENGTGKELVARALHSLSRRSRRDMVVLNCAAIPAELLESELFGHERGAFTHAFQRRIGRFEQANGSTVLLDEIGELPLSLQSKLLRFLQSGELQRLGGDRALHVDVRVLAATNRDVKLMVKRQEFREDLFYRLYVVPITLPPLRDRMSDIPVLVDHFLRVYALQSGREMPAVDPDVYDLFQQYSWPGNVRELENIIQRLLVLSAGDRITIRHLPSEMLYGNPSSLDVERNPFRRLLRDVPSSYSELQRQRREVQTIAGLYSRRLEDNFVDRLLASSDHNISLAAKRSGMHRTTIHRNLRARGTSRGA